MTFKHANEIIYRISTEWARRNEKIVFDTNFENLDTAPVNDYRTWFSYLQERGKKVDIHFLEKEFDPDTLRDFLEVTPLPLIVFEKHKVTGSLGPVMIWRRKNNEINYLSYEDQQWNETVVDPDTSFLDNLGCKNRVYDTTDPDCGLIYCLVPLKIVPVVSYRENYSTQKYTPMKRLWYLLGTEKRDIFYVYIYALMGGLLSLTLPLGVQSIIGMVSGGLILSSVVVLISFVILGTLISGLLQVMQLTIVESIQQRLFARAAFEFTYRIPRLRMESLLKYHAPELVNRFFDILTVQKGLAKLLTDLITGALQILFGILLLAFYHPFFVFFGIILFAILIAIFVFSGRRGLYTSIDESDEKYKMVYWLEEIARALTSFKMVGNADLALNKTNRLITNYVNKRKLHFRVLVTQYSAVVGFKTVITGGVLIIGSMLVVDREITIGQFVASEIVIITVIAAVEKLILSMDTIYDLLTAVEKVAKVTDIPLEESPSTLQLEPKKGFWVRTKNLTYKYPRSSVPTLKGINFEVMPKQHVGIIGNSGAGKTTLMYLLTGMFNDFDGAITYNGFSIRDLDVKKLRNFIGDNLSSEDVFEGSIMENILLGRKNFTQADLGEILDMLEINEIINVLPDGLNTKMLPSGRNFESSFIKKVILARSLIGHPPLVVFDDFFFNLEGDYKRRMLDKILSKDRYNWSVIAATHDPILLSKLDKIYVMKDGQIVNTGDYNTLIKDSYFSCLIPNVEVK